MPSIFVTLPTTHVLLVVVAIMVTIVVFISVVPPTKSGATRGFGEHTRVFIVALETFYLSEREEVG